MGERLLRDLFPVTVYLPDGTRFLRARAFVTDVHLQVWTEGRPPVLAYQADVVGDPAFASIHASAGSPHGVPTPDGLVRLTRAIGACSCSMPGLAGLAWRPPVAPPT